MRPAPLPRQLGSEFSVQDALLAGVQYGRLRRSDLEAPFPGVRQLRRMPERRHESSPAAHRESPELMAIRRRATSYFAVARKPDIFLSHTTAALLLGLPLPRLFLRPDCIEVSRFLPSTRPRGAGILGHELARSAAHIQAVGPLSVSDPASTWAMLADRLSMEELVALGDAAILIPRIPGTPRDPHARGLATLDELRAALEAVRRAGAPKLRRALPLIRQGAASRPESLLRLQLEAPGMPPVSIDHDVYDGSGRFLGCSELAYPDSHVAVEYESEHHRVDRKQWYRDLEKYADYEAAGWSVVRITADSLFRRPGHPLHLVRGALQRAGKRSAA